jgi:hypothetical protein
MRRLLQVKQALIMTDLDRGTDRKAVLSYGLHLREQRPVRGAVVIAATVA